MAIGIWDRTFRAPVLDALFAALAGLAFLMLFDGVVTLLRLLAVGLLRVAGRVEWAAGLRRSRTSRVSFPLAALWFCLAWRVFPEDSAFGFVRAGAFGTLAIGTLMLSGVVLGASMGRLPTPASWVAAAVIPVAVVAWLLWPGPGATQPDHLRPTAAVISLDDPGAPGPYRFATWSYGSGTDPDRVEYSSEVDVETTSVDGTGIWDPPTGIIGAWWRNVSGVSIEALPLQALVWDPERDDPAPLFVIAHGNHVAGRPSDPGYAYLGEHLASRGYFVASIDENFLNGGALFEPGGSEMALRSWLITEHLALWQRWNADPASPLYGRVDLGHVVVAGHSRGGEAATHAAGMLERQCQPVAGRLSSDLDGVDIVGIVSIAPPDGQWQPCGSKQTIKDTSFLTISGGHDADTEEFYGLAQYSRTHVDEDGFKAAVYIHRANHGQFNSLWGTGDPGGFDGLLLDRASLLSAEEQQQAAKSLIGAFVEATAGGRAEYAAVFSQPDLVSWLPDDTVVTRYRAAGSDIIEDATAASVGIRTETGFDVADSVILNLPIDDYPQSESVRRLEWPAGPDPVVSYSFDAVELTEVDAVTLDLIPMTDGSRPGAVVTLTDANGARASSSFDATTAFRPRLDRNLTKWPWLTNILGLELTASEPEDVMQTYLIPLADFVAGEPEFDPAAVVGLDVSFDGSAAGGVYFDGVGFTPVAASRS